MSYYVSWCCGAEIQTFDEDMTDCCCAKFIGETDRCSQCKENAFTLDYENYCSECGNECQEIETSEYIRLKRESYDEMQSDCELR